MRDCALAKSLEAAGDYPAAREALSDVWPLSEERPVLDGLDAKQAAHLLLRAGALTGWLGDTQRIPDAQSQARTLLEESCRLFTLQGDVAHLAEARAEIAWCHWREGAYSEARLILRFGLALVPDVEPEIKAHLLVRLATVERMSGRVRDAYNLLRDAAPLISHLNESYALKGRFYGERAVVLRNLAVDEGREDYLDMALIDYAASSINLELAGNFRFFAYVENNLGFLYATLKRFEQAHEHLHRARKIFVRLRETGSVAQVDETRARALLAEGRNAEAEAAVQSSIRVHEAAGEQAFLAQALITRGVALARLGRHDEAYWECRRAMDVASSGGDTEGAGRAALTILEELREQVSADELLDMAAQAERCLAHSQHLEMRQRLRACLVFVGGLPRPRPKVVRLLHERVKGRDSFNVEMSDDALVGLGICGGDVLRFRSTGGFVDGDLVVVETPEGIFVLLIFREPGGLVRLEGAHPHCPVRRFRIEEVSILGVACFE